MNMQMDLMIFECVVDDSCKYEVNEILNWRNSCGFKSLTVCLVFKFQMTCCQRVATDILTLHPSSCLT